MIGLGLEVPFALPALTGGAPDLPENLVLPALAGTGAVGSTLTGSIGTWRVRLRQTFAWSWQRDGADVPGRSGTGAVVAAYPIAPSDFPGSVRLRVTATTAAGSVTVLSAPLALSFPAPVATAGSWRIDLQRDEAMVPFPAAAGFSGLSLAFDLAPGSGALPAGLSLSAAGQISGTPTVAVTDRTLLVRATNPGGSATKSLILSVVAPAFHADYVAGTYSADGTATTTFAGLHSFARAGTALRLTAAGSYESVASGQPRFDHAPGGVPLGLIVEPGGTNLLLWSEAFTTNWTLTGASSSAAGLSIRGRWGGRRIASGGQIGHRLHQGVTVAAGVPLALAAWYLPGTSGRFRIQLRNAAANLDSLVRGPAGALAVTESAAGAVSGLSERAEADGVRTVGLVLTPDFSGELRIGFGPDSAVAGEDVVLLAAQTVAGSPVPTAGTAAARPAESVALTGLAAGLRDVTVTLGDDSRRLLRSQPVGTSFWPVALPARVKRLRAYPAAFRALTLAGGVALLTEAGTALSLETRA